MNQITQTIVPELRIAFKKGADTAKKSCLTIAYTKRQDSLFRVIA